MAINGIVQCSGEFLPDILRLTQAPILFGSTALISYIINILLPMNYSVLYVLLCLMALHGD